MECEVGEELSPASSPSSTVLGASTGVVIKCF